MDNTEKLKIGLIEPNKKNAEKIENFFKKQQNEVIIISNMGYDKIKKQLEDESINTLIVNIFDSPDSVEIINFISEEKKPIPVCLLGTKKQLTDFKGIHEKTRFKGYCNLKTDDNDLEEKVENMNNQLLRCREAKTEKDELYKKLDDNAKTIYNSMLKIEKEKEKKQESLYEENVKQNIEKEVKEKLEKSKDDKRLLIEDLITETLNEISRTMEIYKIINIVIVAFGMLLISFSIYSYNSDGGSKNNLSNENSYISSEKTEKRYDFFTFGGLGLAAIIASLITNPAGSINKTARQTIQIQITYLGFLEQMRMLSEVDVGNNMDAAIKKSDCLEKVTRAMQKTLYKYFDEHKKGKDKKEDED